MKLIKAHWKLHNIVMIAL